MYYYYYSINDTGLTAITRILQDVHRNYNSMSTIDKQKCLYSYSRDAENSANAEDSLAVFEIHSRLSVNGFTQAYSLDIEKCFDEKEVKE
jgi:hypothetical protein